MDADGGGVGSPGAAQGLTQRVCVCVDAGLISAQGTCNSECSLQIIKDFYLLGRGELYQAFIDLAQQMLKTLPTAVTEHGQCGRSCGSRDCDRHTTSFGCHANLCFRNVYFEYS